MENDDKKKATNYYGKKTYVLNPLIARKKPPTGKVPDYRDYESEPIPRYQPE